MNINIQLVNAVPTIDVGMKNTTIDVEMPRFFAGIPGPQGIQGIPGVNGIQGINGNTILYGPTDPSTEGVLGDFYINTTSHTLFGPKTTNWPVGISLVGPQGDSGVAQINDLAISPSTTWSSEKIDFQINKSGLRITII